MTKTMHGRAVCGDSVIYGEYQPANRGVRVDGAGWIGPLSDAWTFIYDKEPLPITPGAVIREVGVEAPRTLVLIGDVWIDASGDEEYDPMTLWDGLDAFEVLFGGIA